MKWFRLTTKVNRNAAVHNERTHPAACLVLGTFMQVRHSERTIGEFPHHYIHKRALKIEQIKNVTVKRYCISVYYCNTISTSTQTCQNMSDTSLPSQKHLYILMHTLCILMPVLAVRGKCTKKKKQRKTSVSDLVE